MIGGLSDVISTEILRSKALSKSPKKKCNANIISNDNDEEIDISNLKKNTNENYFETIAQDIINSGIISF